MASSSGTSRQHELTINDLWDIHRTLISIACYFRCFGLAIGVPAHELNAIDKSNLDFKEKLCRTLEYRLNQVPPLTWEDIVRALRSPTVGYSALASQIEYDYLPHSSSQSIPTPVPPVSDTSDRPGPSHQPSHQPFHPQQHLHLPSHQLFRPGLDLSSYHHLDLSSQPPSIEQNPMNLPHQNLPYNVPHHPLPYYSASQEQSTFLYPNQPSYMYPIPPALHYTPRHGLGAVQQEGALYRTQQYRSTTPAQQFRSTTPAQQFRSTTPAQQFRSTTPAQQFMSTTPAQRYHQQSLPHIQQPPSEHVQFPRPIIQPPTRPSHWQTPHPQLRHSSVHMQYSSNPLYSPSSDSQQSQSLQQPSSVHTVSTPPQYHSPQQVSLPHKQSLSPAPLTKRLRLEPRASSRQQSVPPPSPASSTLVASHTSTPQESIQTSSLQHVQSVASSSEVSKTYSKAMSNFIHSVKNVYRSNKVETFVKFSLTPTKVYINLALIDRHVVEHKEYKDITVAMVQDGNVDVIQEKKERIELDKIASGILYGPSDSNEGADKRLILVEGAPGVGKSTFAWEFCRRWLLRKVAQGYDLVLLLRLRDQRIRTAKKLIDLLYDPSGDVSKEVLDELMYTNRYNVLIILEGYDELPDSVRNDSSSIFNQLISGELLSLATILVTSRPWATKDIRKRHQCRLYQHIEVLGFTKRQIKEYIKTTVPAENIDNLASYLERHPQIRSGMYIPLNSAIVVAVYLASQRGTQPLPKTQTELYTSLVDILIGRHMESHPQLKESAEIPFLGGISVPTEIHQHLVNLSKLAYKGIVESGEEVKLIFSESDLPQNFGNLGFMDSVTDLYLNQKTKCSYNFLHLTFQEFFAAAYISTMPLEKQRGYYQEIIDGKGGRLHVVLRFLSGLKKLDCFTEENAMCIMKPSHHKPPCEFISPPECMIGIDVINWMFEAQSEDKISMILGERKVEFMAKKSIMSPMDYYSLGYCISHSQCQWVLSLTGRMAISKEKIRILAESATGSGAGRIVEFGSDVFKNPSGAFFLIQEWSHCLNVEVLPLVEFEETALHRILSSTLSLMYLSFKEQFNYEPITEALLNNQFMPLKILKFEEIELTTLAGQHLIQFLKDTKLLAHFSLIQCVVPAQELLQVFQVVQQNPVIKESEIIKCKLQVTCDDDILCIDEVLVLNILEEKFVQTFRALFGMESKCVTELVENRGKVDLSNGKLDTLFPRISGITCLIKAIFKTATFTELNISNNKRFLSESCVLVAESLQRNSTLLTLNLSRNSIGNEGVKSLAEALIHNSTLETLNLSQCNIGNEGVVALSQALLQNSSLKVLIIGNMDIAYIQRNVEGARYLAEALKHNSTLEELHFSNYNIGNYGTIALSQALLQNSTLKVLLLQRNNTDETGISSLGYSLQQNHTLLRLDLSHNSIGDKGAQSLAEALKQNSTLEALHLSSCAIGHDGASALSQALLQNCSLKELNLKGNGTYNVLFNIKGNWSKDLTEALKHNFTLEILNLSECGISDDGAIALSQALVQNSSLKVLSLMGNGISKRVVLCLSDALQQNSTLMHLDISDNRNIGIEGVISLVKALSNNSTLEELKLRSCSVGNDGAKALSQSLVHNSSLKILDIGNNNISNTGAAAIAEALTHNSTLLHLNLSHSSIGNEGLKSLSEALAYNSTLEKLDLTWCRISDEGATALSEALYKNSSLKVLNLNYSIGIRQKAREALVTATNHQSIHLHI